MFKNILAWTGGISIVIMILVAVDWSIDYFNTDESISDVSTSIVAGTMQIDVMLKSENDCQGVLKSLEIENIKTDGKLFVPVCNQDEPYHIIIKFIEAIES